MTGFEPAKPSGHLIESQAALPFCVHPRGKIECARRGSNSHRAGFKPAASAVWATRAGDTGGEIRTHKSRFLRTACLPFASLPQEYAGGGTRTLKEPHAHGDLSAARLPVPPPQPERPNSGSGTRTLTSCSKDRRPPLRPPRNETVNPARLERAPSTFARLRSDPSELRVRKDDSAGGRCGSRTHRSFKAPTVFGTARRARAQPSA